MPWAIGEADEEERRRATPKTSRPSAARAGPELPPLASRSRSHVPSAWSSLRAGWDSGEAGSISRRSSSPLAGRRPSPARRRGGPRARRATRSAAVLLPPLIQRALDLLAQHARLLGVQLDPGDAEPAAAELDAAGAGQPQLDPRPLQLQQVLRLRRQRPEAVAQLVADRPQLARLARRDDAAVDVDLRRLEGDEGRPAGRRRRARRGGPAPAPPPRSVLARRPPRPPRRSSGSRARSRPRRRGRTARRRAGCRRRGCRGRASRCGSRSRARCGRRGSRAAPRPPRSAPPARGRAGRRRRARGSGRPGRGSGRPGRGRAGRRARRSACWRWGCRGRTR